MDNLQEKELILKAQQGDLSAENAVALNYFSLAKTIARSFNVAGVYDADDLAGHGMLALTRAIRTYDVNSNASFKTYASRCIKNAIVDVTRKANTSVEEVNLDEAIPSSDNQNPENMFIENETSSLLLEAIASTLTPTEFAVLKLHIESMSYKDIATELGMEQKKVDNTIYSAKKKIKKLLGK